MHMDNFLFSDWHTRLAPHLSSKILSGICLFLLLAAISGCRPAQAQFQASQASTAPVIQTSQPTRQAPSTPTKTPTPVATASPTILPTPTSSPTPPVCLRKPGKVEQQSLRSSLLKLPMEVRVYLPPCYAEVQAQHYPVLYLIHGMNNTEQQWTDLGVDETADRLIQSGEVQPFIIVMPHDRLWKEPSQTNFDEVFIDELIPWADQNYRTRPERAYRAIGGLSRGGMWAIHFGFGNWQLFGEIGAHSAPVFFEDARQLSGWLDDIPQSQLPRIYLDIGDKDYLSRSNQWFENLLNTKNIPHEYPQFPGYHEDAYWKAHVEAYLRWYAAGW